MLHQILGALSRCSALASMCTFSSEKVCEEEHTQVVSSCDTQEAYNTVQEFVSSHTKKAGALPKLQGHLLLIFLSSAVNFVKVSLARLETLTRLSE